MPEVKNILLKENYTFNDLREIMKILRSENGCPWDREQDHKSIRNNFIEETYEAIEAIDRDDMELLKEELGDVLLQVVFHSEISEENGDFNIDGVCDGVCKKLIRRHPHIFADVKVENSGEVLANWDKIKNEEKKSETKQELLSSVSSSLPSLLRSEKIIKKALKNDIDLIGTEKTLQNLLDSLNIKAEDADENTIGSLLFALVKLSLDKNLCADEILFKYNDKFIQNI